MKEYSPNTAKNMFLVGARKRICAAQFMDALELHSRNTWKQMSVYSYKSLLEKLCSRDVGRFDFVED